MARDAEHVLKPGSPTTVHRFALIKIKGTTLRDAVFSLRARRGQERVDDVVERLDEDFQSLFRSEIYPTRMYPLDAFVQFLAAGLELAGEPDRVLVERTEALVDHQLRGIYRVFVRLGSPDFVLKRIGVIHQTYFEGVEIRSNFQEPRSVLVSYHGFEPRHRLLELVIEGFYRKALEISGADDVDVQVVTPLEQGRDHCEFRINWS